jgi:hypothetical protein
MSQGTVVSAPPLFLEDENFFQKIGLRGTSTIQGIRFPIEVQVHTEL